MRFLPALLLVVTIPAFGLAENWPAWRGPRLDGTSLEQGIPLHWNTTKNVVWRTAIPGRGYSSPIVWEDRIFLTACLEDAKDETKPRVLLCLDKGSGKILWQKVVLVSPLERKHRLNSYASSTPATDGKYVFVTFLDYPDMVVACYDFDGKLIWKKSPGKFFSKHGFCSSPILYKNLVIINGDQDAEAYIVALDKATGKEVWRADRPNRTRSYCTPIIIDAAGRKQLVLSGSKCIASYNPDNGKQWWIIDGPTEQFVASLVFLNDVLFMTAGFPEYHIMGIRPDGLGNVTKTHVLWHRTDAMAYVPSPIAHDKYFFMVNDNGVASCWEAKTGKLHWKERLGRHHSASPVSAEGRLYFPDDDGRMWVLKASAKFEVLARNDLEDKTFASPAISDGKMFIRTLHYLYCID
ncbi:MAG: serine/threonine protein kinase [Gemmatales bacterium]|nr:MAG: serine/threonine protein kinase [Gemmatales bacterium]